MPIDNDTIDRIAHLARLSFSGDEKQEITSDLNRILGFVEKLREIDTTGIEPLIYMTNEENVLRSDEVKQDITQDEGLRNAPDADTDYFRVPKVVDKKNT